ATWRHGASLLTLPNGGGLTEAARLVVADAGYASTWLLFCAEGAVLEPDAVAVLVAEAEAAGAGIAGPKLVDATHAEVVREVGLSADRFGVAFTPVDPGEIDHGQHDGTRQVLFVSTS